MISSSFHRSVNHETMGIEVDMTTSKQNLLGIANCVWLLRTMHCKLWRYYTIILLGLGTYVRLCTMYCNPYAPCMVYVPTKSGGCCGQSLLGNETENADLRYNVGPQSDVNVGL